jgi:hypothetical protein
MGVKRAPAPSAPGQFDETTLTMRDLSSVLESFVGTLRGIYHPRIDYPKLGEPDAVTLHEGGTLPEGNESLPLSSELPPQQLADKNDFGSSFPEASNPAIPTHDPSAN